MSRAPLAGHIAAALGAVESYRFGTRTAEFLMCAERRCYVAATMESEEGLFGVLHVRGVDLPGFEGRSTKSTFEEEPAATRVAARKWRWTPAVLVEAQPNA